MNTAPHPQRRRISSPRLQMFAPCPRGLEDLLADDMRAIGATGVTTTPGGVSFSGTQEICYRANLESRIATRILREIARGPYANEDDIYQLAHAQDWPALFDVSNSLRVDVTIKSSPQGAPLKSSEFVVLRIKDAICDRFRDALNRRPDIDRKNPDMRVFLFATTTEAILYLDTSGAPLYQHGHKIAKIGTPLKENLAAGLLRLSGWKPGVPLLDPMCGSGTFLLEACAMSLDAAPGLTRAADSFSFTRLRDHDGNIWRRVRASARARALSNLQTEPPNQQPSRPAQQSTQASPITAPSFAETTSPAPAQLPIWGSDISADALARSRQNLAHQGVEPLVTLALADILTCSAPAASGILIANLPYGERSGELSVLAALYPKLGDALKRNFAGWNCYLLTSDRELPKRIRLQASRQWPVANGALDCRLYEYCIVAGSNR